MILIFLVPSGSSQDYPRSFWNDLRDCNVGMYISNNSLTPDPELEPCKLTSRPRQWFLMNVGLRMSSWAHDAVRFLMLGNPAVWWISSLSIIFNALILIIGVSINFRQLYFSKTKFIHRIINRLKFDYNNCFYWGLRISLGGWIFTYLPFFLMGRVTYLHHYYPALVMGILNSALLIDFVFYAFQTKNVITYAVGLIGGLVYLYLKYNSLCYGMIGDLENYSKMQLISSWSLVNQPDDLDN